MYRLRAIGRYWQTLRHLKPVQLYGRVWFRLHRPSVDASPPPPPRAATGEWQKPVERASSMTRPRTFTFLNQPGDLDALGWEAEGRARLWAYNLHYFDDLNAARSEVRTHWHQDLIADWIAGNPPGRGTGWEPYPASLRIVNWVKWAMSGYTLSTDTQQSLATQLHWLARRVEWHLQGNHLIANAKALVFGGLYFDGATADEWLAKGLAILSEQLPEQLLADGGHFELSPMYHAIIIEDVLDLINFAARYFDAIPQDRQGQVADWRARVPCMLRWLDAMTHPDGEIAFFNDSALGIAPAPAELHAYAGRLGLKTAPLENGVTALNASGYARVEIAGAVLIADMALVGPDYLPAHAHADTLSFELSLGGRRVVVNSGTSEYGSGAERSRQRGTAAHSTLELDGENSSDVWAGFRVGRRAKVHGASTRSEGATMIAEGAHDGYRHLLGSPLHHRRWVLEDATLKITDSVTGSGRHAARILFQLAPGLAAEERDGGITILDAAGEVLATLQSNAGANAEIVPSSHHPRFGVREESQAIVFGVEGALPLGHEVSVTWSAA